LRPCLGQSADQRAKYIINNMRIKYSANDNCKFMSLRLFFILITTASFATQSMSQSKSDPTAAVPGKFSQITDRAIYTYNVVYEIDMLLLKETNEYSEQSLFYFGKYDPWKVKQNKTNPLYSQAYIVPPHSVPVYKKIYLDATEVANIHYQEFLHFIERDSGQDIHDLYVPVLDENYMNNYFNNPEFYFFPVVGINLESARTYCDWKAQNLNEGLKVFLEQENAYRKYKFIGRLPLLSEWKKAAGKRKNFIRDKTYELNKKSVEFLKNDIVANGFAPTAILESPTIYGYNVNLGHNTPFASKMELPFYIYAYEPTPTGFYNMYGNVKEIVNEGYAIGGSYKTINNHEALFEEITDFENHNDIGFRCVTRISR